MYEINRKFWSLVVTRCSDPPAPPNRVSNIELYELLRLNLSQSKPMIFFGNCCDKFDSDKILEFGRIFISFYEGSLLVDAGINAHSGDLNYAISSFT